MKHGDFTHIEIPADDTGRATRFFNQQRPVGPTSFQADCHGQPFCMLRLIFSHAAPSSVRATATSTLSGTSGRTTRKGVGVVLNRFAMRS